MKWSQVVGVVVALFQHLTSDIKKKKRTLECLYLKILKSKHSVVLPEHVYTHTHTHTHIYIYIYIVLVY